MEEIEICIKSVSNRMLRISVRLWNLKDGGSLKAGFLAMNQHTQTKKNKEIPLMVEVLSKTGHDFRE